jgi:hypothetical protein
VQRRHSSAKNFHCASAWPSAPMGEKSTELELRSITKMPITHAARHHQWQTSGTDRYAKNKNHLCKIFVTPPFTHPLRTGSQNTSEACARTAYRRDYSPKKVCSSIRHSV